MFIVILVSKSQYTGPYYEESNTPKLNNIEVLMPKDFLLQIRAQSIIGTHSKGKYASFLRARSSSPTNSDIFENSLIFP